MYTADARDVCSCSRCRAAQLCAALWSVRLARASERTRVEELSALAVALDGGQRSAQPKALERRQRQRQQRRGVELQPGGGWCWCLSCGPRLGLAIGRTGVAAQRHKAVPSEAAAAAAAELLPSARASQAAALAAAERAIGDLPAPSTLLRVATPKAASHRAPTMAQAGGASCMFQHAATQHGGPRRQGQQHCSAWTPACARRHSWHVVLCACCFMCMLSLFTLGPTCAFGCMWVANATDNRSCPARGACVMRTACCAEGWQSTPPPPPAAQTPAQTASLRTFTHRMIWSHTLAHAHHTTCCRRRASPHHLLPPAAAAR